MGWQGLDFYVSATKSSSKNEQKEEQKEYRYGNDDSLDLFAFQGDPDDTDWNAQSFDIENKRDFLIQNGYDEIEIRIWRNGNSMGNIQIQLQEGCNIDYYLEHKSDVFLLNGCYINSQLNGDNIYTVSLSDIKILKFSIQSRDNIVSSDYDDY